MDKGNEEQQTRKRRKFARKDTFTLLDVKILHETLEGVTSHHERMYLAALWYANNGVRIVPFRVGGYPIGLSQRCATSNVSKVSEWWHPDHGAFPGAAIAMAHGGAAGTVALDLDCKLDVDGMTTLADLAAMYSRDDDDLRTLMAVTPSGGRHLIFQFHPEIISNAGVSYPGIDARGGKKSDPLENGGITFVEPSIKPGSDSSVAYKWDETVTEVRPMPQWLVDCLCGRKPSVGGDPIRLQDAYVEHAPGLHGDGRDRNIYIDLLRFAGIGYDEDQLRALKPDILSRMFPPDAAMVDRKIESVLSSDAFKSGAEKREVKRATSSLPFIEDKNGRIVKCVTNLEIIISSAFFQHEYGVIEYDDFTQGFTCNGKPMASVVDWAISIQSFIARKFAIDFNKTEIRDVVENMAYTSPHINIARDYFMSVASRFPVSPQQQPDFWGSGRLSGGRAFKRLCEEVLDLGNPSLHPHYDGETRRAYEAFLWFWLQGVAARACVPACKMEMVLNIFGEQGIGKSLFFRSLCPNPTWFTDSLQDSIVGGGQNNRDELLKLHAKIIVEMPELNPIKRGGKSADDKLKQFISAQVDNFRRAYGHDSVDHPRTCALAGTSNNRDVYRDPTGARRFISIDHGAQPIRVGDNDNGVLAEIRDELWAEVVHSFVDGGLDKPASALMVFIPFPLRQFQTSVNDKHRYEEIGTDEVLEWISDKTRVTWSEIISVTESIAGLRDAKESAIMTLLRKELSSTGVWEFRKRIIRTAEDGTKEKTNCWVQIGHPQEPVNGWDSVPPHWSSYTGTKPYQRDEVVDLETDPY